jgi:hypothetical protein
LKAKILAKLDYQDCVRVERVNRGFRRISLSGLSWHGVTVLVGIGCGGGQQLWPNKWASDKKVCSEMGVKNNQKKFVTIFKCFLVLRNAGLTQTMQTSPRS